MRSRKFRVLLAAVTNAFLPPFGYFYAGAWRTGSIVLALMVGLGVLSFQLTVRFPPGFYGLDPGSFLTLEVVLMLATGLHAAWLARQDPAQPLRRRVICGVGAMLGLVALVLVFRAYWPISIYSIASSETEPFLHKGEVVAVQGARATCGGSHPARGEFVVFSDPEARVRRIRSVAAAPGQTVSTSQGRITPSPTTWLLSDEGDSSGYRRVQDSALCGVVYRVIQSGDPTRIGKEPKVVPVNG